MPYPSLGDSSTNINIIYSIHQGLCSEILCQILILCTFYHSQNGTPRNRLKRLVTLMGTFQYKRRITLPYQYQSALRTGRRTPAVPTPGSRSNRSTCTWSSRSLQTYKVFLCGNVQATTTTKPYSNSIMRFLNFNIGGVERS